MATAQTPVKVNDVKSHSRDSCTTQFIPYSHTSHIYQLHILYTSTCIHVRVDFMLTESLAHHMHMDGRLRKAQKKEKKKRHFKLWSYFIADYYYYYFSLSIGPSTRRVPILPTLTRNMCYFNVTHKITKRIVDTANSIEFTPIIIKSNFYIFFINKMRACSEANRQKIIIWI